MQNSDTTKYIIHATIKADGVIERPDVVGQYSDKQKV